jgi:hypothetical protein
VYVGERERGANLRRRQRPPGEVPAPPLLDLLCWLQGAGCRVQGAGFRVQGSGFRVQGSGFRVLTTQSSTTLSSKLDWYGVSSKVNLAFIKRQLASNN